MATFRDADSCFQTDRARKKLASEGGALENLRTIPYFQRPGALPPTAIVP